MQIRYENDRRAVMTLHARLVPRASNGKDPEELDALIAGDIRELPARQSELRSSYRYKFLDS